MSSLLDITFNSCPTRLKEVRHAVSRAAEQAGCPPPLVQKLVLVIEEAVTNVMRHGYDGKRDGEISLRITQAADRLHFRLRDYASPVDPASIRPRDLNECRPGGLGINFIDSVMDTWAFSKPKEGSGNVLKMTKTIGQA